MRTRVIAIVAAAALVGLVCAMSSTLPGGVVVETTRPAQGRAECAFEGDRVVVHYVGRLKDADGKIFDSSRRRSQPFEFVLGAGNVIPAWDAAVEGMCVEEVRTIVAPPEMAYGDQGVGGVIPPKATLWFEVELLSVVGGVNHTRGLTWDQMAILVPFVLVVAAVCYAGFSVLSGPDKGRREKTEKIKIK